MWQVPRAPCLRWRADRPAGEQPAACMYHAVPTCAACKTRQAGRAARTSALSRPAAVSAATSAGMPWRSARSTSSGALRMPLPLLSAAALLTSGLCGPEQAQVRAGTQARQGAPHMQDACMPCSQHTSRACWMQDLTISPHSPLSLSWERRHMLGARASKARARLQRERTDRRPGCTR